METYDKWSIVYEDSEIDVRRDPRGLEDYGLMIKSNENYLDLPRGTIPDIAKTSVEEGNIILQNLLEMDKIRGVERFFKGTPLDLDITYLNAAITKAYIKEEQRRQNL